jgi:small subunit ribosomal protein S18
MAQRRDSGKKGGSPKDRRPIKKKTSILTTESIEWIDYKDVNLLRRFMSERAKIRARRVTGNDQKQQAAVARAIKLAREMALLPYSVRQVTQRSKGRRDRERGDRGDRGELRAPSTEADVAEVSADATTDAFAGNGLEGTQPEGVEGVEGVEIAAEGGDIDVEADV